MDSIKIDKWTVEPAQMKHTARKYSMSNVAQSHLRKISAEAGIADYKKLLEDLQADTDTYETLTDEQRDFCDLSSSIGLWAAYAGCIKPYIHLEEWMAMDYPTIEKITDTVQKVNPHWFELPEQEKKTDEPHEISMND